MGLIIQVIEPARKLCYEILKMYFFSAVSFSVKYRHDLQQRDLNSDTLSGREISKHNVNFMHGLPCECR